MKREKTDYEKKAYDYILGMNVRGSIRRFGENREIEHEEPIIREKYTLDTEFGEVTFNAVDIVRKILGYGSYTSIVITNLITDKEHKRKEIGAKLKEMINPNAVKLKAELMKEEDDKFIAQVRETFDALMQAAESVGDRKTIKRLKEIDELKYCEAEPLLDREIKRISRRNTVTNIKLHNEYLKNIKKEIPKCSP
jgi:hypothetical protein